MSIDWSRAIDSLMTKGITQGDIAKSVPCTQGRVSQMRKTNPVRISADAAKAIEALCRINGVQLEPVQQKTPNA